MRFCTAESFYFLPAERQPENESLQIHGLHDKKGTVTDYDAELAAYREEKYCTGRRVILLDLPAIVDDVGLKKSKQ